MSDRLPEIRRLYFDPAPTDRAEYDRLWGPEVDVMARDQDNIEWLVAEVDRYREALRQVAHYDVEANHGPTDEWAEAEAFAAVSEIAAGALYYWEKKEQGR